MRDQGRQMLVGLEKRGQEIGFGLIGGKKESTTDGNDALETAMREFQEETHHLLQPQEMELIRAASRKGECISVWNAKGKYLLIGFVLPQEWETRSWSLHPASHLLGVQWLPCPFPTYHPARVVPWHGLLREIYHSLRDEIQMTFRYN